MADKADEAAAEENVKLDEHTEGLLDTLTDTDGTLVNNPEVDLTIEKEESETSEGEKPDANKTEEPETESEEEVEAEQETDQTSKEETETKEAETDVSTEQTETEAKVDTETEKDESGIYVPTKVEDPGEFKPGDYSFEITTTDGKTHKISTPEEADSFAGQLDDNPELISASQFAQFNRKLALMDVGLANDKRDHENKKIAYEQEQESVEARETMIQNINSGMNYLQSKGELLPVPPELNREDVKWEEHADNEAIRQRLDILQYIYKENEARIAVGLQPSFDPIAAHNAMQLEAIRNREKENITKEKTASQKRGAKVAGKSAFVPDTQPSGTIVGEGGSLNDLVSEFMNQ